MNRCKACNIKIIDNVDHCPLCNSVLEQSGECEDRYPNIPKKQRAVSLVRRIIIFLAIFVSAINLYIDFSHDYNIHYSLIVVAGCFYGVGCMLAFTKQGAGYRKRTFVLSFFGLVLVFVIDVVIGYTGWSLNYVLPGIYIYIAVAMLVLMIVNNRSWQSYLILQLGMTLLSGLSLILIPMGIITVPILSVIAFGLCLFSFLGCYIIGGPKASHEMRRRFHIR